MQGKAKQDTFVLMTIKQCIFLIIEMSGMSMAGEGSLPGTRSSILHGQSIYHSLAAFVTVAQLEQWQINHEIAAVPVSCVGRYNSNCLYNYKDNELITVFNIG